MAKVIYTIDASLIAEAYKKGFEDAFIILNDDSELDEALNCNRIVTKSDRDNDEV